MSPSHLGASETGPPEKNSKNRRKQYIRKEVGRAESDSKTGIPASKIAVGIQGVSTPGIQASTENKTGIQVSE